ncbi:MAG: hypothetical protein ACKPKO_30770, partial [Candidatus Fonsibacter sp.]
SWSKWHPHLPLSRSMSRWCVDRPKSLARIRHACIVALALAALEPQRNMCIRLDAMHRWIRADLVTSAVMARTVQATVTISGESCCQVVVRTTMPCDGDAPADNPM